MSSFTLPLKEVIELTNGNIGLDSYPIFDEKYREVLNKKIIDRYFNREIGQESISMFTLAMRRRMNEIMPYYNAMYESEKFTFDPFSTFKIESITSGESELSGDSTSVGNQAGEQDVVGTGGADSTSTKTQSGETDGNSTSSNVTNGVGQTVNSEMPQQALAGNADYATASTQSETSGTSTGNGTQHATSTNTDEETTNASSNSNEKTTSTANDERSETTKSNASQSATAKSNGYQMLTSSMLLKYRETLLNIDLEIIEKLSDLFMLVWDTNDSFTEKGPFNYYVW